MVMVAPPSDNANTALVLTGGGARAAYQVGVLKAIRELLPGQRQTPFPILCGSSAGAINATVLASSAEDFGSGVDGLLEVWQNVHAPQIYRSDLVGVAITGAKWLGTLMFGWLVRCGPKSLLDNAPLRRLLKRQIDFALIEKAIDAKSLRALSITCSGYSSGQSITFYQGASVLEPWRRYQRAGVPATIKLDHLLASSAIPFVFPAIKINREYFGDGSMRQMAPVAPAIHLGANKILVVGVGQIGQDKTRETAQGYPSLAQIAGHALSSIFLDSLSMDTERLERINHTLSLVPEAVRNASKLSLRPLQVLVINPSKRLDDLASVHAESLPWPIKLLLRGIGAMNRDGGALVSYLLFEPAYTRRLIDLGYKDAMARKVEICDFFRTSKIEG